MAPTPLLALRETWVTFGGAPLFKGLDVHMLRGDKICLVGRNGSGKSSLLKALAGKIELDGGERFVQPGIRIAYLEQDPKVTGETLREFAASGLPDEFRGESHRTDIMLEALGLDPTRTTEGLSGGERRRAALAQSLAGEPDVLLLDEPTNHLDLEAILWVERQIAAFRGAMMVISHDRAFLRNVSRQTIWLDRGKTQRNNKGYDAFAEWSEAVLEIEARDLHNLDKAVEAETHWLHRGVTARRHRNEGRLRRLHALWDERAAYVAPQGKAKVAAETGKSSGKMVVEVKGISKSFDNSKIIDNFSTRILRGDRVGVVGPNGAGKSTLIKLLTGELAPDSGSVKLGTNLELAYFDQMRDQLDPEATLWDTLTGGSGDQIVVRGKPRHVVSYLKDFLFEEGQARQPVGKLSGGERNRLLLALHLSKTANLVVLDEPTNDLDMDTLDVLEEMLAEFDGTLIIVSHDRDFLDRLVTSTIAVEGGGVVEEYVGGYTNYLNQRNKVEPIATPTKAKSGKTNTPKPKGKLTYNDQRLLDQLPGTMDALRAEITALEETLSSPTLFSKDPKAFNTATDRLVQANSELDTAEERWLELEMAKDALK